MLSAAETRCVSVQSPTRDPTVRVPAPTSSALPTLCVLCSMESPGACVTRGISQQEQVSRVVLTSTSALVIPVAREHSVRTLLATTGACVPVDSVEILMLLVWENRVRSSAAPADPVQLENCAARASASVSEVSRERHQDCAETLMNVLWHHPRTQSVVRMHSVRIFPAALTVSVLLDTMATPSSLVRAAMELTAGVHLPTTSTPLVTVCWRAARPRLSVERELSVSASPEESHIVLVLQASTLNLMEAVLT